MIPLVKVKWPAIPENLIESELFGYERGGFTGAQRARPGQFELADQGTFFLDEISEISLHAQSKIMQALDGEPFIRIGGVTPVQFNVRVIAATSLPLEEAVARGKIREEVVFRLSEVVVQLPPLRAHREDIPLLAEHFAYNFCKKSDIRYEPLPDHVIETLQQRDWPGNTRELAARVREYLTPGGLEEHLPRTSPQDAGIPASAGGGAEPLPERKFMPLKEARPRAVEQAERALIEDALRYTLWNRRRAARLLDISYSSILRRIEAYEIGKI